MAREDREESIVESRSGTDGHRRRERSPRERSPGWKRGGRGSHRHRGGGRSDDDLERGDWAREGERRRQRFSGSEGRYKRERDEEDYPRRSMNRDRRGRIENISPSPRSENHRERERDRRRIHDSPALTKYRGTSHRSNQNLDDSPRRRRSRRSSSLNEEVLDYSERVNGGDTESEEDRRTSELPLVDRQRETSPKVIKKHKSGDENAVRSMSREIGDNELKNDREAAAALVDYVDNDEDRGNSGQKLATENSGSDEKTDDLEERSDDHDEESSSEGEKERAREKKVRKREKGGRHSERKGKKRKHRRSRKDRERDDTSESYTTSSSSSDISDSEERRRKRRKRRRRKEKDHEREREMKRKVKKKMKELKEKKLKSERKEKHREIRSKQPITSSWGKYGILKDIDMWNKRPEFTAWLAEVKKVNMETLANWEEKQMFKEYMEDYNTATFPSKKFYNLDIYHRRKAAKERMKGMAKLVKEERTDFNDEDDRRIELLREREQQKEAEVGSLLRKMQSGMAQDMKEQAKLREEMQYQFRLGNTEAAQAIQRRLDPDAEKFTK